MIEFKKQEKPLVGDIKVQGDRKISYLSIFLASLALGQTKIYGLLESADILNLIETIKQFDINIQKNKDNVWLIDGKGITALKEPINVIDVKNSEEMLYLLVGLFSSYNFKLFFKGGNFLSTVNLKDIIDIFKSISINFNCRNNEYLPFLMIGNNEKKQLKYELNDYDILLKDILLLSFVNNPKENIILEKEKYEDHLENLMKHFGILFEEHDIGNKGNLSVKIGKKIILKGCQNYSAKEIVIPSDISFSSFIAGLAILIPDSNIILKDVLMNQYRDAFYRTLIDMGADITFINKRIVCGEKVVDINVKYLNLKDTIIPGNRVYKMMFEYPILIFIASISKTSIEIQGTKIIKTKDLENYNYMIKILSELGVNFLDSKDSLKIKGGINNINKKIILNNNISPNVQLSIAMFGLFLNESIEVSESIELYFPNLKNFLNSIGLNI